MSTQARPQPRPRLGHGSATAERRPAREGLRGGQCEARGCPPSFCDQRRPDGRPRPCGFWASGILLFSSPGTPHPPCRRRGPAPLGRQASGHHAPRLPPRGPCVPQEAPGPLTGWPPFPGPTSSGTEYTQGTRGHAASPHSLTGRSRTPALRDRCKGETEHRERKPPVRSHQAGREGTAPSSSPGPTEATPGGDGAALLSPCAP